MFKELFFSAIVPASFVVILILVKVIEITFGVNFVQYGVFPRNPSGLIGILTYPFIHSGWPHLLNNSSAIMVLGTMLFYSYRQVAIRTVLWVYIMSGVWLWIAGRANFHIGASGIVYALFGFLFISGLIRKHLRLMALSFMVIFLYGSLVWGIFPMDEKISWEGHLFGLLSGIAVAIVYRKQGPQKPKYSWDFVEEEETPEWFPDAERDRRRQAEAQLAQQKQKELEAQQHDSPKINIRYVFKREKSETDGNKKGEQ
ncbi:MAG: rhomboid family intramembrane serine protease [Flavobacteriales bacterium]